MQIEGGCLCGAVRYKADIDPKRVVLCYCTDCQTLGGGAFRAHVLTPRASFEILSGTVKLYCKTADSGRRRALAFCPECGTSLYGMPDADEEGDVSLRVGTIDQRAELTPAIRVWYQSAPPWMDSIDALPAIDRQPGV